MCCGDGGSCKYEGTCIRNLGWTSVVLAVIGFILAVVADGVYAGYPFATLHHISTPIWGGAFVVVAGGLAVCGGNKPDNACLRIALLVMSIFGILFAMLIWIMASVGLAVDGSGCDQFILGPCGPNDYYNCNWWWSSYWYNLYPNWRSIDCGGIKALHALQLILGLTEMVLMFILSIRSCCGTCGTCCQGTQQQPPTHAIIYQPGQPLPQQVHSGVIIMQTVPGAPGQQPTYNPQAQAGAYPAQPQPGAYPGQPGQYPTQAGQYPTQAGAYPTQAGQYPTQAGAYPTQAGQYPPQAQPPPAVSQPPPYDMVTDQKI